MASLVQKFIVEDAAEASPLMPQRVALVDPQGNPVDLNGAPPAAGSIETAMLKNGAVTAEKIADGVLPAAATAAKAGVVKKSSAVAAVQAPDAAPAASAPTKEEFDKAVAGVNECKRQLNQLIANMKSAGLMA